jgi:hypothetical protein
MSKKDFTKSINRGLDILTGGDDPESLQPRKQGRPQTSKKVITNSTQEGTKPGESRVTYIVKESLQEKVKAIAYWERVLIKDVINPALQEAVDKYEKKNGIIKPIQK